MSSTEKEDLSIGAASISQMPIRFIAAFTCFLVVFMLSCCKPEAVGVERSVIDGVEVVLNRQEPVQMKGEPSDFDLNMLFSIDTEKEEIAEIGLTDIRGSFGVDSEGNLYLYSPEGGEEVFYKFDARGAFVRSFGRVGQGPGEIQRGVSFLNISPRDEVVVTDPRNKKVVFFDTDGGFLREFGFKDEVLSAEPLDNGNFLLWKRVLDPTSDYLIQSPLVVADGDLNELEVLDRQRVPNPMQGERLKGTYHVFSWAVAGGRIFSGFQERGYEIPVFDLDGEPIQKIKKEYKPVPVPEEHKEEFMLGFSNPIFDDIRNKIYFPDSMPAFHAIFSDDRRRLFVMTYEKGETQGEYIFDIFNDEGVFIGRKGMRMFFDENGLNARIRNDRLYCLQEKESGYKELVVYSMIWK